MASVSEFRKGWRAYIQVKGYPRKTKTFETREEAENWARAEESKLRPNTTAYDLDAPTLREIWTLYEEKNKTISSTTFAREKRTVKPILQILGDYAVKNVSSGTIQRYFDKRVISPNKRGKMPAPDTLRLEKALLSKLFKVAQVREYADKNPVQGLNFDLPKCENKEKRIFLPEQRKILAKSLELIKKDGKGKRMNEVAYPYLQFLFATGMRPGEAAKIEMNWISQDTQRPIITIPARGAKKREPRILNIPKTIIFSFFTQYNRAKDAGSKYIFYSKATKTGEFVPYRYSKAFARLADKCGIDATPHTIRHELISRLFEETTLSDSVIGAIIGHKHTASLTPYKHLRGEALRQHVDDFNESQLARVAKLVSASDLKSDDESHTGSTPVPSTIN